MTRRGVPGAPRRPDISSTGSVVRASGWPRWHSVRARTTATPNRGRQMTSEPRTQPRSALGAAARYSLLVGPLISMMAFVLASAGCAIAPNISLLIAARGLQGLVGAPLVPLALSILLGKDGLSGGKVPISAALTLFLAPALGPTLGGLLIGAGGWRWIFLINLPVGIAGLLLLRRVPRTVGAQPDPRTVFDPMGFVLLAVGLVGALFGATEGTSAGWSSPASYLPLGVGLALLTCYTFWALRRPHPVVNLHMVMHRDAALALVLQVLCSVVAFVMPVSDCPGGYPCGSS